MNIATMKIFQKKQEILSNHSNLISKFFVEWNYLIFSDNLCKILMGIFYWMRILFYFFIS